VIDGIDGFSKLTDEKNRVGSFLSALCNELRALGVTTLATAERPCRNNAGPAVGGNEPDRPVGGRREHHRAASGGLAIGDLSLDDRSQAVIAEPNMRMRRFDIAESGIVLESDHHGAENILSRPLPPGRAAAAISGSETDWSVTVRTVLIVEDEWAIADWLEVLLGENGYNVLSAGKWPRGARYPAPETPDLVLTDFMMPSSTAPA